MQIRASALTLVFKQIKPYFNIFDYFFLNFYMWRIKSTNETLKKLLYRYFWQLFETRGRIKIVLYLMNCFAATEIYWLKFEFTLAPTSVFTTPFFKCFKINSVLYSPPWALIIKARPIINWNFHIIGDCFLAVVLTQNTSTN